MRNLQRTHVLIALAISVAFAGCLSGTVESGSASNSSTQPGGGVVVPHPSATPIAPPVEMLESERAGPLVGREYIQKLLSEIFYSATHYAGANNVIYALAGQKNQLGKPSIFGVPCDPYSSSAQLDCNGDVVSGATAPMMVQPAAVRQLNKLKLCEQLISFSTAPKAAAEKIGELTGSDLNEITATSLPKIFSLFYRGRDMKAEELAAYMAFNQTLKDAGRNVTDRWRAVLSVMCESPDWEIL